MWTGSGKYFFCILIACALFHPVGPACAMAERNAYDSDADGWVFYGNGVGEHRATVGALGKGSLYLSCNKGETSTVYKKIKLAKGRYKVAASLRSLDIQHNPGGALWLFYNSTTKIQFASKTSETMPDWTRVEYVIDVDNAETTIWFRLRSPGMVLIDDFSVTPHSGERFDFRMAKTMIQSSQANPSGEGVRCQDCKRWIGPDVDHCPICGHEIRTNEAHAKSSLLLYGFESGESAQGLIPVKSFSETASTQQKRSGVIPSNKFINFDVNRFPLRDWSEYDYISLDVFNPTADLSKFAIALGDKHGRGYWKELNNYTMLVPGWNHLTFEINRYVGERGSVKFRRFLDLASIQRAWFRVTHNGSSPDYLVDNIRLETSPDLKRFEGLLLFDFVQKAVHVKRGFTGVESRNAYSKEVGFGFRDHTLWRTHDSVYSDTLTRDGIFILDGKFLVDVPNGKYVVHLIPNALGYWNENFWKEREIRVEGKALLEESRKNIEEYLANQLRFSEVEPGPGDNPYDLYLKKVFKDYSIEVEVTDGQLTIECEGDGAAILLNALVVYPAEMRAKAEDFFASLDASLKRDFSILCRDITRSEPQGLENVDAESRERGFYAALIDSDNQLRANQIVKGTGEKITLRGGLGERPVQALMVRNLKQEDVLKITMSPLRNSGGEVLFPTEDWVRYGVSQYQSHTMNHEVFELAPRFLRSVGNEGIRLASDSSLLIWCQVPLTKAEKPGTYAGTLELVMHGAKKTYPVSLDIYDYSLPKPDVAVGFFGLDPVSFAYVKLGGKDKIARDYRFRALESLAERGFSTWSGLPGGKWHISKNSIRLYAPEVDDLMERAKKLGFDQKVFTYGGWQIVDLDNHGKVAGIPQEQFRKRTAAVLRDHMQSNDWLPVVLDVSDEATGYSQKAKRDIKRAEMVRRFYPFLKRGGYSHPPKKDETDARKLNSLLTDISLSSQTKAYAGQLHANGVKWGYYNQAANLFANGRYAFGVRLYAAARQGLGHQLGWSLTGSQNYPYYDLDGREFDAMMVFPRKDGGLDYALKYEWAAQGLEDYRLLLLLESLVRKGGPVANETKAWLAKVVQSGRLPEDGNAVMTVSPSQNIPIKGDGDAVYRHFRDRVYRYINALTGQ